jgi:hypothetical protein
MCLAASFIVTKDRDYWSPWDESHERIREEYGLPHNTARPVNVQVEITPPELPDGDYDFTVDPHAWQFNVDQTELPKWWTRDPERYEQRCREVLCSEWHPAKVMIGVGHELLSNRHIVYMKGVQCPRVENCVIDTVVGCTLSRIRNRTRIKVARDSTFDCLTTDTSVDYMAKCRVSHAYGDIGRANATAVAYMGYGSRLVAYPGTTISRCDGTVTMQLDAGVETLGIDGIAIIERGGREKAPWIGEASRNSLITGRPGATYVLGKKKIML